MQNLKIYVFLEEPELIIGAIPINVFAKMYEQEFLTTSSVYPYKLREPDKLWIKGRQKLIEVLAKFDKSIILIWGAGGEPDPSGKKIIEFREILRKLKSESFTQSSKDVYEEMSKKLAIEIFLWAIAEPNEHIIECAKIILNNLKVRTDKTLFVYSENWTRKLLGAIKVETRTEYEKYRKNVNYLCHNHFQMVGDVLEVELTRLDHRNVISDFIEKMESSDLLVTYGYSMKKLDPKPALGVIVLCFLDYFDKKEIHVIDPDPNVADLLRNLASKFGIPFDDKVKIRLLS
jgi:hypothetical protein